MFWVFFSRPLERVQVINELVNTGMRARLPHRGRFAFARAERRYSVLSDAAAAEAFGAWRHDSALSGKTPGPGGTGVGR